MDVPAFDPRVLFGIPAFRLVSFAPSSPAWTGTGSRLPFGVPHPAAVSAARAAMLPPRGATHASRSLAGIIPAALWHVPTSIASVPSTPARTCDREALEKHSSPQPASSVPLLAQMALERVLALYAASDSESQARIIEDLSTGSAIHYENRIVCGRTAADVRRDFATLLTVFKDIDVKLLEPPSIFLQASPPADPFVDRAIPAALAAAVGPLAGPAAPIDPDNTICVAVPTLQVYKVRTRALAWIAGMDELQIKTRLLVTLEKETGRVLGVRDEW
ncbi:hypothetical protein DFJ74DRAFT_256863 [Hyaloraphidium curvatum]|nr:hypothetical protein DFJ74DRAFT_256863 [Hyaloraphidium curvatum]